MVPIATLWLPILLSAVIVFVASSVVWMVLPFHRNDFAGLPDEDAVREALRSPELTAGQYHVPHASDRDSYRSEEIQRKMEEGPVAMITVMPDDYPAMGKQFVQWFLNAVLVSAVAACVAAWTLPAGTEYTEVFRLTGTVAFTGYGLAYVGDAVWFGRPWGFTVKMLFDALIYGLLTAGVFGWLWPA